MAGLGRPGSGKGAKGSKKAPAEKIQEAQGKVTKALGLSDEVPAPTVRADKSLRKYAKGPAVGDFTKALEADQAAARLEKSTVQGENLGVMTAGLPPSGEILPVSKPKIFELGEIRVTARATRALALARLSKFELLERHQSGDFGDLPESEKAMQLRCAQKGSAVRSMYKLELDAARVAYLWSGVHHVQKVVDGKAEYGAVLRVLTVADRSVTWMRVEGDSDGAEVSA